MFPAKEKKTTLSEAIISGDNIITSHVIKEKLMTISHQMFACYCRGASKNEEVSWHLPSYFKYVRRPASGVIAANHVKPPLIYGVSHQTIFLQDFYVTIQKHYEVEYKVKVKCR